jgi:hypothetical protein
MPDLVIPFEPRALMSLLGIVTLVLEVWKVDRNWDEEGEKAYVGAAKESKSNTAVVIPPQRPRSSLYLSNSFFGGMGAVRCRESHCCHWIQSQPIGQYSIRGSRILTTRLDCVYTRGKGRP